MKNRKNTAGFTLIELSIVLVIIGLIIGGVLTGKQVMQNGQITNTQNSIQAYEAQFQTYVQNYSAVPGDDASAPTRFQSANLSTTNIGDGNGILKGSFDSVTTSDETRLLWVDLRAAGLVKGAPSNSAQPTNAFNGIFGFQNGAFNGVFTSNVICLNNVPGDSAEALDARLDDGSSNTGNIQAMISTNTAGEAVSGTVATSYVSTQTYTMCIKM